MTVVGTRTAESEGYFCWDNTNCETLKLTITGNLAANKRVENLSRPGCYSLVISLQRKKTVGVGKLGKAEFPQGTYLYTGSALNGLRSRLRRHLTPNKKLRWHIDYLLHLRESRINEIFLYPATPGEECRQNQRIAALPGAELIVRNFGASDCKSGCPSHLWFFRGNLAPHKIEASLRRESITL